MAETNSRNFRYKVRYSVDTAWSFLTQADHYADVFFDTPLPLAEFAKQLAATGFETNNGKKWIMPGAIHEISRA